MADIPESQLARARVAGVAAAKVGMRQLGHSAKRPFLSKQQQAVERQSLEDRNAELIFDALSQLRGTAVKLAQMVGMESDLLPPAYHRELKKSWHQVPPLNRVLVRKMIQQEFSKPPEQLFGHFDDQAFAAASLGQVHAATLPSGTDVVVKIQYPGISATLKSDIALLRKLLTGMPNHKLLHESVEEIQLRLIEETDYHREKEQTRWFAEHLNIAGVDVPEVFGSFSGKRVLTTERVAGLHLDAWLQTNPGQQVRDRAAQLIYDVFVRSSMTLGRLHADPNPGNYLFREDGSIGLIDFGCTKQLSANFIERFPYLLRAYTVGDKDEIINANADLGIQVNNIDDEIWHDVLQPFGEWLAEPFHTDAYDFRENANYTTQAKDTLHKMTKLSHLGSIPDDFIFFDRTIYGLCKIFERLGATVRLRHHWFPTPMP